MKSRVIVNRNYLVDKIDNRIYSGFVEHLGRAVYEGIYQPGHPSADEDGFRRDVIELIRELDMPLTRYPGGNFVSGYNWEDGVGPREQRPARLDLAWKALEPNLFGTDEFMKWCRKANTAPMMAVNLGTRGAAEAQQLVEYCNFPGGTALSDQRRRNGAEQPYGVKVWCLGNEMDGPWQTGHRTADEYGRTALEAAKMMKWTDPSIELVVCGSSHAGMPTLGEWESKVLDHTYDLVDYLSIHHYFGNRCDTTPGYLAQAESMSDFIDRIVACCDFVRTRRKSQKRIMLSFDEWNVWFHSNGKEVESPEWSVARPLLEDVYTMEDALLVGMLLMTLINHADRVKIACLAQLVNVIAPIMTNGEKAWAQTIFYPYLHASRYGRGISLKSAPACGCYTTASGREVPVVETASVWNEEEKTLTLFAVNKSAEPVELETSLEGFGAFSQARHITMQGHGLKEANTADHPDNILPQEDGVTGLEGNTAHSALQPYSWNVIRIS